MRGHYASKRPHHTLAIEYGSHKPLEIEEEVVNIEGGFEDLLDVENSLLHDAHLELLANPTLNDEWKVETYHHLLYLC